MLPSTSADAIAVPHPLGDVKFPLPVSTAAVLRGEGRVVLGKPTAQQVSATAVNVGVGNCANARPGPGGTRDVTAAPADAPKSVMVVRELAKPRQGDWVRAKQVLRYLRGVADTAFFGCLSCFRFSPLSPCDSLLWCLPIRRPKIVGVCGGAALDATAVDSARVCV